MSTHVAAVRRGDDALLLGAHDDAIAHYSTALSARSLSDNLVLRALCGRSDAWLAKSMRDDVDHHSAGASAGAALSAALADARRVIATFPTADDGWLRLATAYAKHENYERARHILRRALVHCPDSVRLDREMAKYDGQQDDTHPHRPANNNGNCHESEGGGSAKGAKNTDGKSGASTSVRKRQLQATASSTGSINRNAVNNSTRTKTKSLPRKSKSMSVPTSAPGAPASTSLAMSTSVSEKISSRASANNDVEEAGKHDVSRDANNNNKRYSNTKENDNDEDLIQLRHDLSDAQRKEVQWKEAVSRERKRREDAARRQQEAVKRREQERISLMLQEESQFIPKTSEHTPRLLLDQPHQHVQKTALLLEPWAQREQQTLPNGHNVRPNNKTDNNNNNNNSNNSKTNTVVKLQASVDEHGGSGGTNGAVRGKQHARVTRPSSINKSNMIDHRGDDNDEDEGNVIPGDQGGTRDVSRHQSVSALPQTQIQQQSEAQSHENSAQVQAQTHKRNMIKQDHHHLTRSRHEINTAAHETLDTGMSVSPTSVESDVEAQQHQHYLDTWPPQVHSHGHANRQNNDEYANIDDDESDKDRHEADDRVHDNHDDVDRDDDDGHVDEDGEGNQDDIEERQQSLHFQRQTVPLGSDYPPTYSANTHDMHQRSHSQPPPQLRHEPEPQSSQIQSQHQHQYQHQVYTQTVPHSQQTVHPLQQQRQAHTIAPTSTGRPLSHAPVVVNSTPQPQPQSQLQPQLQPQVQPQPQPQPQTNFQAQQQQGPAGQKLYDLLQVPRNATESQIKKQYYLLARKYHPDKNADDVQATEQFQRLAEAYRVLSDRESRAVYDRYGDRGLVKNGVDVIDPSTLFAMVFGSEQFVHLIGELQLASMASKCDDAGNTPAEVELVAVQRSRVGKLVLEMVKTLKPWVDGDKNGFLASAHDQVVALRDASFGPSLLHTVGTVYVQATTCILDRTKNPFNLAAALRKASMKSHKMAAHHKAMTAAAKVMDKQRRLHDRVMKSGRDQQRFISEREAKGIAVEMAENAIDMMWKISVIDIETTLEDVLLIVLTGRDLVADAPHYWNTGHFAAGGSANSVAAAAAAASEMSVNSARFYRQREQREQRPSLQQAAHRWSGRRSGGSNGSGTTGCVGRRSASASGSAGSTGEASLDSLGSNAGGVGGGAGGSSNINNSGASNSRRERRRLASNLGKGSMRGPAILQSHQAATNASSSCTNGPSASSLDDAAIPSREQHVQVGLMRPLPPLQHGQPALSRQEILSERAYGIQAMGRVFMSAAR